MMVSKNRMEPEVDSDMSMCVDNDSDCDNNDNQNLNIIRSLNASKNETMARKTEPHLLVKLQHQKQNTNPMHHQLLSEEQVSEILRNLQSEVKQATPRIDSALLDRLNGVKKQKAVSADPKKEVNSQMGLNQNPVALHNGLNENTSTDPIIESEENHIINLAPKTTDQIQDDKLSPNESQVDALKEENNLKSEMKAEQQQQNLDNYSCRV